MTDSAVVSLMDFERVIDELDVYAFAHWKQGELAEGPVYEKYFVTCTFMWPHKKMPDPRGGERLLEYDCKINWGEDVLEYPIKVKDPADYKPGTKVPKLGRIPVWIVEITMPKKLMQDIFQGYTDKENRALADSMKYEQMLQANQQAMSAGAEDAAAGADTGGEAGAEVPTI